MAKEKPKSKIVYPQLSYQIVGAAFEVIKDLGWGLKEKDYAKAMARELENRNIPFKKELLIPLEYKGEKLGRYFADFVIGDKEKIIVELKVVSKLGYEHVKQLLPYLKSAGLKLGILIYFTKDGVKFRRVLNPSAST